MLESGKGLGEPALSHYSKINCLNTRQVAAPPTMELGPDLIALLLRLREMNLLTSMVFFKPPSGQRREPPVSTPRQRQLRCHWE
jgi:hypothetical protein